MGRHAWVDMRLHESHNEGEFGIPNNTITRLGASYTTNARFVACWAPCLPYSTGLDDGQRTPGFSHLGCPPCLPPKRMHEDLLQHYDCTDQPAAAQPVPPSGAGILRAEASSDWWSVLKKIASQSQHKYKIIIFFFRRSKRQRNFSLFYFASQES